MTLSEIKSILDQIAFRDWEFRVGAASWLQVRFWTIDAATGIEGLQSGRKWRLSQHMTRSEIVQTALMAVLAAVEHEAREEFTYRGEAIFGPHHDVEALVGITRETRAAA